MKGLRLRAELNNNETNNKRLLQSKKKMMNISVNDFINPEFKYEVDASTVLKEN